LPSKGKRMMDEPVAKKSTCKKGVEGKSKKKSKNESVKKKEVNDETIGATVEENDHYDSGLMNRKVKFEIYGEEMIEKKVKSSGNSGRVYLPPNWVGRQVKIIRID